MRLLTMRTVPRAVLWMAALALAAPAAAQRGVPALPLGDSVRVTLTAADPALEGWGSYRVFRFQARPQHVYHFTARADLARVGLRVARLSGLLTEYVASSGTPTRVSRGGQLLEDEGPEPGSANLRFYARQPGQYLLVLTSPDTAALTLSAQEITPRAPAPRPIALGARVRGELNAESGMGFDEEGDGLAYDLYSFSARGGQRVEVAATGATALLGRMRDGVFQELAFTDTTGSGGGLQIPADGEYAVRVSAPLSGEDVAAYTLWLVDAATRPAPRRLEVGQMVNVRFDPEAAVLAGGELVDQWVVRADAGQRLRMTARSTPEFDTYLILGRVGEGGWRELTRDDDGAGERNSLIDYTAEESGDYVLRVRPFSPVDSAEAYTLLVEPQRRETSASVEGASTRRARPETRAVRWGAPLTGALDDADAAVEDGSPYDVWTFSASAGQRIVITLRSEAFDAFLAVGREVEGEWIELTSNDDAEQGSLDARVVMLAPDTGVYAIRVNTLPGQPPGAYTLTVERAR